MCGNCIAVFGQPRRGATPTARPPYSRTNQPSSASRCVATLLELGYHGVAALRLTRREPKGRRHRPRVARRSLRSHRSTPGLSWGRRVAAAAARAKGQETPTQGCATFAALTSLHRWAIMGSPRCGCRGESQRTGDTDPGLRDVRCAHIAPPLGYHGVAALRLPRREPKDRRHEPRVARRSLRSHRSTAGLSWGRRVAAAAARAKGQETPTQGCATFAALTLLHHWAIMGSPRCGCRSESQRTGDTNPGLLTQQTSRIPGKYLCEQKCPGHGWRAPGIHLIGSDYRSTLLGVGAAWSIQFC
jgi:hypothetical protein